MAAHSQTREIEKFFDCYRRRNNYQRFWNTWWHWCSCLCQETIDNLLCGYHLTILRPKKQAIGQYVCYALTSPRVKYDFYRFANGITRFGLTTESYQKIKIPLPLPHKQKRIANILDTAKEEVKFLEQLAEQYRTQKRGLMQKLLTGKWRVNPNKRRRMWIYKKRSASLKWGGLLKGSNPHWSLIYSCAIMLHLSTK